MPESLDLFKHDIDRLIKQLKAKAAKTVSDSKSQELMRLIANKWHSKVRRVITRFVSESSPEVLESDNYVDRLIEATTGTADRSKLTSSARALSRTISRIQAQLIKQAANNDAPASSRELIDPSRLSTLRSYIAETIRQINVTYERQCPDACALMLRRLIEFMLLDFYALSKRESDIIDGNGQTKELKTIINHFIDHSGTRPSQSLKEFLRDARFFGGTAAHNARVMIQLKDIDGYTSQINIVIEELRNIVYK